MDRIDDLLGDDEEETQSDDKPVDNKANAAFAQQRKELAALKKEAEELRAFRVEREKADRDNAISGVFTEVGLNPKHAKLFSALNPEGEATPELVAQFASEYGLVTNDGEEVEAPPKDTGFKPTVIPESHIPGSKVLTHDEFAELMNTDPNEAFRRYKAGRVKLDTLSDIGGESIHRV